MQGGSKVGQTGSLRQIEKFGHFPKNMFWHHFRLFFFKIRFGAGQGRSGGSFVSEDNCFLAVVDNFEYFSKNTVRVGPGGVKWVGMMS